MLSRGCVFSCELADQVGQHAAGNLIDQRIGIGRQHAGRITPAVIVQLFSNLAEMSSNLGQRNQIQTGIILSTLQGPSII